MASRRKLIGIRIQFVLGGIFFMVVVGGIIAGVVVRSERNTRRSAEQVVLDVFKNIQDGKVQQLKESFTDSAWKKIHPFLDSRAKMLQKREDASWNITIEDTEIRDNEAKVVVRINTSDESEVFSFLLAKTENGWKILPESPFVLRVIMVMETAEDKNTIRSLLQACLVVNFRTFHRPHAAYAAASIRTRIIFAGAGILPDFGKTRACHNVLRSADKAS